MDRSGTQMGSGIERRQEHLRPWRTREVTPEKVTEGVMMNTSKVNESAPMIVRVAQGALMAGHGAQKLFGSFGGPGVEGTSSFTEMLGLKPGKPWAWLAALSEFGGGVLTVLGLLNPLGPIGVICSMAVGTNTAP